MRFGVVGTNWITDTFIEAVHEADDAQVTAVCSRKEETALSYANKHQLAYTYTSLEAMCESGEIDAVYLATPNAVHHEQVLTCLAKGVPVLCEKPLTATKALAEKMIDTSRKHHVLLMEAMKSTAMPNFQRVKELISSIGTIRQVRFQYGQYSSRYDKFKAGEILNAFKPDMANGSLMDLGVYTLYPIISLFGSPDRIQSDSTVLHTGVDGQGSVLLSYEGMIVTASYSKIADSFLPSEISGENGAIHIDHISSPGKITLVTKQGTEDMTVNQNKPPMSYEIEEFIKTAKEGKIESSINTHEISLQTVELMEHIRKQNGIVYPLDTADGE
ncbi:Gfo/Idh/MocA family protein [Jeotgalibacillus salarius]|uniref:Gfo/Idh/MocA family oxidoreductase n=1 Tax=Jeotgalibacillus salarius TaxID=546023 RepID=A0A4Y8LLG3_9BACL|nr:Gfo/Idh/MocA family oxidoreductase [Jeotgalibacillus salarius]TFE02077.1 Gfo/Idh/MocA family oxidoreductase [Jeotgalibacillus salarius]